MFTFVTLVFKVEIDGRDCDPFAMYRFKGLFPEAFRASSIRLRDTDGYSELFSQNLTPDPSALKRFQKPPLPFAFRLPKLPCKNTGSSNIEITLSLAGSAVNHLKSFIVAVEETLKQIAYEQHIDVFVSSVSTLGPGRTRTTLGPDFRELSLLSDQDTEHCIPGATGELSVTFLSPLCLLHDGRALNRLDFPGFIRPLMRRVSSLAYYYSGVELQMDFRALSEQSVEIESFDVGLSRERWQGCGSGLMGRVVFRGPLQPYLGLMSMGEHFNLGKGAAYGMGAFEISR